MSRWMIPIGVAAALVFGVGVSLTFSVLDRGDDSAPGLHGGRLAQALAVVPADATSVEYVDRVASLKAAGIDPIGDDASKAEFDTFLRQAGQSNYVGTGLDNYLGVMWERHTAFTALDVEWGLNAHGDGIAGWAYRMSDRLDLNAVISALEKAGWKPSQRGDGIQLSTDITRSDPATGLLPGGFPQDMMTMTVVPERHLILSSLGAAWGDAVLDVLGGGDSLRGDPSVQRMASGDPVIAQIARGDGLDCGMPVKNATPAQMESLRSKAGTAALGHPDAAAIVVPADGSQSAILHFADGHAAESDAAARKKYLATGISLVDQEPMTKLIHSPEVTTDGDVETVAFEMAGPAAYRAVEFLVRGPDGPVACN